MCNYFKMVLVLIGVCMIFGGCTPKNTIEIVAKESFYSNYIIEGDKVYIECKLMIKNVIGNDVAIELFADFKDDVEAGLLKEAQLKGFQEDRETSEFILSQGTKRIVVVFIGDFAGTNQKHDRNLPIITINQQDE